VWNRSTEDGPAVCGDMHRRWRVFVAAAPPAGQLEPRHVRRRAHAHRHGDNRVWGEPVREGFPELPLAAQQHSFVIQTRVMSKWSDCPRTDCADGMS